MDTKIKIKMSKINKKLVDDLEGLEGLKVKGIKGLASLGGPNIPIGWLLVILIKNNPT